MADSRRHFLKASQPSYFSSNLGQLTMASLIISRLMKPKKELVGIRIDGIVWMNRELEKPMKRRNISIPKYK